MRVLNEMKRFLAVESSQTLRFADTGVKTLGNGDGSPCNRTSSSVDGKSRFQLTTLTVPHQRSLWPLDLISMLITEVLSVMGDRASASTVQKPMILR